MQDATPQGPDSDKLKSFALFVPRLMKLMGRVVADSQVATGDKLLLGAALLYVASPLDLLPDSLPVIGQLDDLYLLALCLLRLLNRSGEDTLRRHWDGPEDIVDVLHNVTDLATRYLPETIRGRIREWVEAKSDSRMV